jgi:hypothetical protein
MTYNAASNNVSLFMRHVIVLHNTCSEAPSLALSFVRCNNTQINYCMMRLNHPTNAEYCRLIVLVTCKVLCVSHFCLRKLNGVG